MQPLPHSLGGYFAVVFVLCAFATWGLATYNFVQFNARLWLAFSTGRFPKMLSLRAAVFLRAEDIPPECRPYRRRTRQWAVAFGALCLVGVAYSYLVGPIQI